MHVAESWQENSAPHSTTVLEVRKAMRKGTTVKLAKLSATVEAVEAINSTHSSDVGEVVFDLSDLIARAVPLVFLSGSFAMSCVTRVSVNQRRAFGPSRTPSFLSTRRAQRNNLTLQNYVCYAQGCARERS